MGLFSPKWMSKDKARALAYVEQLTDEGKLLSAALESPHFAVRATASRKLVSDDAIVRFISESDMLGAKRELMCRISDKSRLEAFFADPNLFVRFHALKACGKDAEAFAEIQRASDAGTLQDIRYFTDDLDVGQCLALLATTQDESTIEPLLNRLESIEPSREQFEEDMCDLALDARWPEVSARAKARLTLPQTQERYQQSMKVREHERQLTKRAIEKESIERITRMQLEDPKIFDELRGLRTSAIRTSAELEIVHKARRKMGAEGDGTTLDWRLRNDLLENISTPQATVELMRLLDLDREKSMAVIRCIDDPQTLRQLARSARSSYVRFKACKKSGGHVFDENAAQRQRCRCTVCGFEDHPGCPNDGSEWTCARCHATIKPIPFVSGLPSSTIRYDDGSEGEIAGYDGHQEFDDRYSYT